MKADSSINEMGVGKSGRRQYAPAAEKQRVRMLSEIKWGHIRHSEIALASKMEQIVSVIS